MDFKKANSHKGFQQTTNDQNEVFRRHVAAHLDGVLHNVLIEQCGIFLTVHCILKVKVLLPTCFVFITARVRSTREGNVLTSVCPSIHPSVCPQGGSGYPPWGGPGIPPGGLGTPRGVWVPPGGVWVPPGGGVRVPRGGGGSGYPPGGSGYPRGVWVPPRGVWVPPREVWVPPGGGSGYPRGEGGKC